MKFMFSLLGVMLLVALVRLIGALWLATTTLWDWVTGRSHAPPVDTPGMLDALAQGWHLASPFTVAAALVLTVLAGVCAVLLALPLVWAVLLRSRPARVFVSYQHGRQALAQTVVQRMCQAGLLVDWLPFVDLPQHDQLLDSIRDKVAACDFFICLPGPAPSHVDHEVAAAVQLGKPLLFIVDQPDGLMPNTAQKSYPVLATEPLVAADLAPLVRLLRFLYGDWRSTWALYAMSHRGAPALELVFMPLMALLAGALVVVFAVLFVAGLGFGAAEFFLPEWLRNIGMGVIVAVILGVLCLVLSLVALVLLFNATSGMVWRRIGLLALQRRVRQGEFSNHLLRQVFQPDDGVGLISDTATAEGKAVINCLWDHRPPSYHEAIARQPT